MERAEREFDTSQDPADAPCEGSRGGAREEALDNDGVKPSKAASTRDIGSLSRRASQWRRPWHGEARYWKAFSIVRKIRSLRTELGEKSS
jgi:hypothetical protein